MFSRLNVCTGAPVSGSVARLRAVLSVLAVAVTGFAGVAMASPKPHVTPMENALQYDVSFQDGRTQSLIGQGIPNERGIVEGGDPEDLGPAAFCFDRNNPPSPEVMASVEAAMRAGYGSRYFPVGRWNGAVGAPITLTWSLVPDTVSIPGGGVQGEATSNSQLFTRMDTLFGAANRAVWIAQIQACFDRWAAISGISYTRVTDGTHDWDDGAAWGNVGGPTRGDIRISMHPLDGVNGVLAYNQFPTNGDMVIDSSENWAQGAPSYIFLRNCIMHEHGHGLGFAHTCPTSGTKLMEPFLNTNFDGPQQDDIRGVHYNYGDNFEPNGTTTNATDLGTLAPGSTTNLGTVTGVAVANAASLSISTNLDADMFKITLADPRLLDVTVTPIGTTYLALAQNGDGSCPGSGTADNALAAADLAINVYNSNGSTSLRLQNATAVGAAEAISGLLVSSGVSYIKVYPISWNEDQFYRISITVRGTNLSPTASDGTFTDHVHISWPAVADATSYQVYRNVNDVNFGGTTIVTLPAPATSFDDLTAVPGQVYYYFVKVQEPGNTGYRFTTDNGNSGYKNVAPVANAGPDQNVVDTDNNGSQAVTLDGTGSSDTPPGTIITYHWAEGATLLAQSGSPSSVVTLSVGTHVVTLIVTDNNGAQSSDDVTINIVGPSTCGSADFNGDGDVGTDSDIEAFFACLAGSCCATCGTADFNGDGDIGTDADIEAFFRVLAGGPC